MKAAMKAALKKYGGAKHVPYLTFAAGLSLVFVWNATMSPPEDDLCKTINPGHQTCSNAWDNGVKIMNRPSSCLVKGFPIEELDPEVNFRRSFEYGFSHDVEDRQHLKYYLRAAQDLTLQSRKRRVYLDLGGSFFNSSVLWFLQNYPIDFTEIHVFEQEKSKFVIPSKRSQEEESEATSESTVNRPILNLDPILDRIKVYNVFVSNRTGTTDVNGVQIETLDITRFIKEELKVTKDDTLMVKMDIEGSEYDVFRDWMEDPEMSDIVDEIFVEVHYKHSTMTQFYWDIFAPKTREDATTLFKDLRKHGFFVHSWP